MTATNPTKPSLETCAALIHAARKQLDGARNAGDEQAFDEARTAFIRANDSARKHGYAPSELNAVTYGLSPSP